jgi:lipopolysaccharide transport system ATP-binding protein
MSELPDREIALRIVNLSKFYRLGEPQMHMRFADVLASMLPRVLRSRRAYRAETVGLDMVHKVNALVDVTLEIARGDVVGIIGPNGAGKSTLMKILTRITPPNQGRVEINGRIGALLEVGTGFHPELTGRENVFLNGAMIGMSRAVVAQRMSEIVDFSEIGRFIDTPVKWYSSGMFTRLAFSVAAHLDAEIMLVDEVLSVGDVGFQRKCLSRIRNIASDGRTVLLVSHNMASIKHFCDWAVVIDGGRIVTRGDVDECIKRYHEICGVSEVSIDGAS